MSDVLHRHATPGGVDAARLFTTAARRFAPRVAIIDDEGSVTYRTLLERTGRLAVALATRGVQAGDRVVMVLPNGARFVETWWAIVRLGAVVVPVNARASADELAFIVRDTEASAIIIDARAPSAPALGNTVTGISIIAAGAPLPADTEDYDSVIDSADDDLAPVDRAPDDPCAIYYTAGSTGRPKGVVRSQLAVAWGLGLLSQRLTDDEIQLARTPMSHAGGSLTGPFAALIIGARLVIPARTDPAAILDAIERHRITRVYVHPTYTANGIFDCLDRRVYDLSSLRRLQWTAGALPEGIKAELRRRFPTLPIEVTYGMTEVSNMASYVIGDGEDKPANCVGYPLPGAEIAIEGPNGTRLADGEGEILVRSPIAMLGYWRLPTQTEETTRGGWIHTGDLGRLDADGALLLTGRRKEVVNTGGMSVHPAEVEQAIAAHAEVADVAVFGLPHPDWEEAVTAVVARRQGASLDATALLAHCRQRLTYYKLPKAIHFLEELPRNGTGKIDKRALVARFGTGDATAPAEGERAR
jgi:acyl-CoA synthetase (AMP-forming)/AMP-acid ligase II